MSNYKRYIETERFGTLDLGPAVWEMHMHNGDIVCLQNDLFDQAGYEDACNLIKKYYLHHFNVIVPVHKAVCVELSNTYALNTPITADNYKTMCSATTSASAGLLYKKPEDAEWSNNW